MLEIAAIDGGCSARTGTLHLPRGDVEIPAFLPVGTNGTVKAIEHSTLRRIGYSLILGNTYHLYLRPGIEVIKKHGGLHGFSSWDGNILTDSGGYQVFSLASLRVLTREGIVFSSHIDGSRHFLTPESVVDMQVALGSNIQMQLDVCTAPGIGVNEAREAVEFTALWAKRAKQRYLEHSELSRGYLFGIVQGNFFKELRAMSSSLLLELDLPGYAIGGLSVGEDPESFKEFLRYTASLLPDDKPRYTMGIGTPRYMLEAVETGIDFFDCVYPTRIARNGTCFTPFGIVNIRNSRFKDDVRPIDPECICPACMSYSRSYLRHLFVAREILGSMLLTHHNLQFVFTMMKEVRRAITNGTFLDFKRSFLERFEAVDRQYE